MVNKSSVPPDHFHFDKAHMTGKNKAFIRAGSTIMSYKYRIAKFLAVFYKLTFKTCYAVSFVDVNVAMLCILILILLRHY